VLYRRFSVTLYIVATRPQEKMFNAKNVAKILQKISRIAHTLKYTGVTYKIIKNVKQCFGAVDLP